MGTCGGLYASLGAIHGCGIIAIITYLRSEELTVNTFDCIKARRSIRRYTDDEVAEELVDRLLDAARLAPFGGPPQVSGQLWEFVVVRDAKAKRALTHEHKDRMWVKDAPVVIAVCADVRKDARYRNYDFISALAVENLLLAATALGLGTCIVDSYVNHTAHEQDRKLLRETLGLPDHIRLECLITVGYPNEEADVKDLRPLYDMKHVESFQAGALPHQE